MVKTSDDKIAVYSIFAHFGKYINIAKVILKSASKRKLNSEDDCCANVYLGHVVMEEKFSLLPSFTAALVKRKFAPPQLTMQGLWWLKEMGLRKLCCLVWSKGRKLYKPRMLLTFDHEPPRVEKDRSVFSSLEGR